MKHVVVAGDIVIDHHIYEGERQQVADFNHRGVQSYPQVGGAASLAVLIDGIIKKQTSILADNIHAIEVRLTTPDVAPDQRDALATQLKSYQGELELLGEWDVQFALKQPDTTADSKYPVSLALWSEYPEIGGDGKGRVWRADRLLGYGSASESTDVALTPIKHHNQPDILVLDDSAFAFRHKQHHICWLLPKEDADLPDWIVLKMSGPVCAGDLWHAVTRKASDRLIVIVAASELRKECLRLGRGLSWESTVEDAYAAFQSNPLLQQLASGCRHLIVTFHSDGALWIDSPNEDGVAPRASLIYDATSVDGAWASGIKGEAFGYLSCMTASVVRFLIKYPTSPSLHRGHVRGNTSGDEDSYPPSFDSAVCLGLQAMRDLRANGHGKVSDKLPPTGFPANRLAAVIVSERCDFSVARVPWTADEWAIYSPAFLQSDRRVFRIVEASQCPFGSPELPSLVGLASQLVVNGMSTIKRLPHAKFGKLTTADRGEIEALRNVERLMLDYQANNAASRPLSIGVFGPPGAGKSFGVKQIATQVFGPACWLEFNLSQFRDETDLIGALHRVRDLVLSHVIPVVFWDEFDSRNYQWLQYLLAPMQDGKFQEGQSSHFVGQCVFVFAGATSYTFEEFGPPEYADVAKTLEVRNQFKLAKGPDFHSRLDAYINVLGPNRATLRPIRPGEKRLPDANDVCVPLRRALLIRSWLGVGDNDHVDFDIDLLIALLLTEEYTHGARSLEKLITSIKPPRPGMPVRRSSLPPSQALSMHISYDLKDTDLRFDRILSRNTHYLASPVVDRLAEQIHERWRASASTGNRLNVNWSKLTPTEQGENIAAARRIPGVLAMAGLKITLNRDTQATPAHQLALVEHLRHHVERLAEAEHEGWMADKVRNGWIYGVEKNSLRKEHPCIVPYSDLPEVEKSKDRESVLRYPTHVQAAGYEIEFIRS